MDLFDKLDTFISNKKTDKNISDQKTLEENLIHDEMLCIYCNTDGMFKGDLGFQCVNCGYVGDKIIDLGAEWRYYGVNDTRRHNPTRTGNVINPLLPKSSMGTFIGGSRYSHIQRIHTWTSMPSNERSLWIIYKKINRLLQNSDVANKIIDESKFYYKKITENDKKLKGILTRGSIRQGLIAACVYISCKKNGVPKHSKDIAELCNIDENLVTKGLKKFVEIEKRKKLNINNKQTKPKEFVNIYCNKLNLPADIKRLCLILCERTIKLGILKNNTPPSVAGGIVYLLITKLKLDVSKVALINIIKISEVTLNKTFKKLSNYTDILFIGFEKIIS